MSIYQGQTKDGKTISLPTEEETICALAEAGGGTLKNILHNYSFKVEGRDPTKTKGDSCHA